MTLVSVSLVLEIVGVFGAQVAGAAVTNYPDPTISAPNGIAPGPDGALWFTNQGGNSIGRITTAGSVTNFTDPTINSPAET